MIKVAFVGCAHIHTPNFVERINQRDDVQTKYVWDHDGARAQINAEKLGATAVSDPNTIWHDGEVTAVIICSETNRHLSLVKAACAAGKHLFVEKPLGMGASDSRTMAELIAQADVLFQTGYFMRGFPDMQFAKAAIKAGHFGKITRIRLSNCHSGALGDWFTPEWLWMTDPLLAGVGAFGDMGTHVLDILLWWLGRLPTSGTAVVETAVSQYGSTDEYGECLLRFDDGLLATITAGWVDVADPVKWEIRGTEGHAWFSEGNLCFKSSHVAGADGSAAWATLPEKRPHAFEQFLNALTGDSSNELISPQACARRDTIVERLYEAAKTRTWVRL